MWYGLVYNGELVQVRLFFKIPSVADFGYITDCFGTADCKVVEVEVKIKKGL